MKRFRDRGLLFANPLCSRNLLDSEAEARNEKKLFDIIMADPGKARVEIEKFQQDNPTLGDGSRKRLIDFTSWHRLYGTRTSVTNRERELLVGIDDYFYDINQAKGMSRQESDKRFAEKLKDPSVEREGSGAHVKIWIQKPRERFKDVTRSSLGMKFSSQYYSFALGSPEKHLKARQKTCRISLPKSGARDSLLPTLRFSEAHTEEASKQMRNVGLSERDAMVRQTGGSVASHSDAFLRGGFTGEASIGHAQEADGGPATISEGVPEEPNKKRLKRSNVEDEEPKQYGKLKKELPQLRKSMADATTRLEEVTGSIASCFLLSG